MKSRLLNHGDERTFAVIFDSGDEVMQGLSEFAVAHAVSAASFTAIGGFSRATLGYYDFDAETYLDIPIDEQVEVLSLVGDVSLDQDKPRVHAHVVVGDRDGRARGGHLLKAFVRPTLEVVLVESPAFLRRAHDEAPGLPLISL
jgi:predicted DNA-binding protein with PD1-like motif